MSGKDLEEVRDAWAMYLWTRARIAELEEQQRQARTTIEEHLGDSETGYLDGRKALRWAYVKQERVDVGMVRKLFPDIARACTKTAHVRTMKVVDE